MLTNSRVMTSLAAVTLVAAFGANAGKGPAYGSASAASDYSRFTLTGGATYMLPNLNTLDYAQAITTNADNTNASRGYTVDPSFDWGYYLAGRYNISQKYDVQLDWSQLNTENSDNKTFTGANPGITAVITSAFLGRSLAAGEVLTATSKEKMEYQVLNATLGQHHLLTQSLSARLFGGLRYAKIDTSVDNFYFQAGQDTPFDLYDSSFSGIGPLAGLDLEYQIYDTFGVVGSFAAALLVGNQDSKANVAETAGLNTFEQNTYKSSDDTRVVPALDAKLGLTYDIPQKLNAFGFSVEGGYKVSYYFDAADQPITDSAIRNTFEHNYYDVGMMGPYLNVSAMF